MVVAVNEEIVLLIREIRRLGNLDSKGQFAVKFGIIVKDEICGDIFEALVGTLRAAKKRGIINFAGEMLLSPTHDKVDIILLKSE